MPPTWHDRQIADFVDDQQLWPAQEAQALAQAALALGLGQRGDQLGQGAEVDAAPGLDGFDAERDGQMRFSAAGLPEKVDDLVAIDELQLRHRKDPVAIERGLEGEVETGQGFDRDQAPHLERGLDAPGFAQGEFLAEQGVDRFQRADLAALELAHRVVEDLKRARHFEPDEVAAHLIDGARRFVASHSRPPSPARRRPTAS